MKINRQARRLWLMAIGMWAALSAPSPFALAAESVSDRLAEINRLEPAQRKKRLEEGAKKEGELILYASENLNLISDYEKAFAKRYPFLKLKYWRAGGDKVGARVLTEIRANKLEADLIGIAFDVVTEIEKTGVFASYLSPERKFLSNSLRDKRGHYNPTHVIYAVIAYNTNLVSAKEAPTDYPDLLDPKWSGSLTIDAEPSRAVMGWLKAWGEEKTRRYAQGLARNGVKINRGHTLQTQLLCAGEHKIAVELYLYTASQMRRAGCPLAIVYPNPVPVASAQSWGITTKAAHPHAAALFVDYLLSLEAGQLVASRGRAPARSDVEMSDREAVNLKSVAARFEFLSPEDATQLRDATARIVKEFSQR